MPRYLVLAVVFAFTIHAPRTEARVWVVDQNHPQASDSSQATAAAPCKTINRAAEQAMPGDTVLVHAGVYRERVAPERSGQPTRRIVYMAAPAEEVVIKGSDVWKPQWKPVKEFRNVFTAQLDPALFRSRSSLHKAPDYNPYAVPLVNATAKLCLGQLFVDGEEYRETDASGQVNAFPGTWFVEKGGKALRVHFAEGKPIDGHTVELTVRGRIFAPYRRATSYITVRGFIMEHCANQYPENFYGEGGPPQAGAIGCRGGSHWIIEQNTVRRAKNIGIDCGREGPIDTDGLNQRPGPNPGYHIIRYNVISHNGSGGIVGEAARGTLVIGNTIDANNTEGIKGMEGSGIKFHGFHDGLIEGNLIRGNYVSGIWLDADQRNSRITRNVVVGNIGAGIFIELGLNPVLIDNNVVAFTVAGGGLAGDGIYSHDASNVTVAHNLVYFNANFGVWAHVGTDRGRRQPPECSGWEVVNNIIVGNHRGAISLPPPTARSRNNRSDRNLLAGPHGLTLSETWGAEMDQPVFLVNTNKDRFIIDSTAARFRVLLDSVRVADSLRPNIGLWKSLPVLTLDQWRLVSGYDRHSLVPVFLRPELTPMNLVLHFIIDQSPRKLGCATVKGADRDLFGNALPAKNPLPGPFQKLVMEPALADRATYATPMRGNFEKLSVPAERTNRFSLWPIRQRERTDYLARWRESMARDIRRSTERKYPGNVIGSVSNPAPIRQAADSIIVDGDMKEWAGTKSLPAPYEEKDTSMLRLLWRAEGIYGLARPPFRRIRTTNREAPWEGDCIELFVQKDGKRPSESDSATARYIVIPVQDKDTGEIWTQQSTGGEHAPSIVARCRQSDAGYFVEFFLPAAMFKPGVMQAGTVLGFNYAVNVRGDPAEEFFAHRAFDETWRKPVRWGSVKLVK